MSPRFVLTSLYPRGHSLCGGWITPATTVSDPLEAIGIVILGAGKPIVLCAVDWTGILNEAHLKWREALAEGAGTTVDRVTLHTVHQHNAPFASLESQRYGRETGQTSLHHGRGIIFSAPSIEHSDTFTEAIKKARPVTAIATAEAPVSRFACNRRIIGNDGKMRITRGVSAFNSHPELPRPAGRHNRSNAQDGGLYGRRN